MQLSCVCLAVCLPVCVCLSVTLRYCIKMAKRRITQIMPYDRSRTLVYQYRLESRTYRMALLIASRGPSALAELLVTAWYYASAVYAVVVCLSVTLWYCTKTAQHRIMQIMPHDSLGTLLFWCQRTGWPQYGGNKCKWGGLKLPLSTKSALKTVQDRRIVSIQVE